MSNDLKFLFHDWTDWDVAAFNLAKRLGILDGNPDEFGETKHLFWADTKIGNSLQEMLNELSNCGVLEKREEPDRQFRWNIEFNIKNSR